MKKLLFLFFAIVGIVSNAQTVVKSALPNPIAASPEAASLGKYGDYPIGYQTGTVNVGIPIVSLKNTPEDVVVNLSYHTGGNKVEEVSSQVGLGWSLFAGGTITRSQRGLEDEAYYGYFNTLRRPTKYFDGQMTLLERTEFEKDLYCGIADGEADVFNYNFGGYSGKFFLGSDSIFHTIPRSNLVINFSRSTNIFTIQDDRGSKYVFNIWELTLTEPYCNGSNNSQHSSNNTWHLGYQINAANDSTFYSYRTETVERQMIGNDEYNIPVGEHPDGVPLPYRVYCHNVIHNFAKILTEIRTRFGRIVFRQKSVGRADSYGSFALDYIALLNNKNDTIRKTKFFTSYFNGEPRLRLDSIKEFNEGQSSSPYIFSYHNAVAFPSVLSQSQDLWGYYNGANNLTLVRYQKAPGMPFIGGDRSVRPMFSKMGILETIKYPTGGSVEFVFEPNTYSKSRTPGLDFEELTSFLNFSGSNAPPVANYIATFQQNFVVTPSDIVPNLGYCALASKLIYESANPSVINQFSIALNGANGYSKANFANGDTFCLGVGSYTINASIETEFANTPFCNFNLEFLKVKWDSRDKKNYLGGGVRVKQIKRFFSDNITPQVENYSYLLQNDTISSGFLNGDLPEMLPYERIKVSYIGGGSVASIPVISSYITYGSGSTYPMLETSGKPIAYEYVEVKQAGLNNQASNGLKAMRFSTYSDYPDYVYPGFPFLPAEEHSWRRGNLLSEIIYKSGPLLEANIVRKTYKGYNIFSDVGSDPDLRIAKNVKFGVTADIDAIFGCTDALDRVPYNHKFMQAYRLISTPFSIKSDSVVAASAGESLGQVHKYGFASNNLLIQRDSSRTSTNETIFTTTRFAKDFSQLATSNNFIGKLLSNNRIVDPIEKIQLAKKDGQDYVINAELIRYNSQTLLPDTLFFLESAQPILYANFMGAAMSTNNVFVRDSRYKVNLIFTKYDNHYNPIEAIRNDGMSVVWLYGYNKQYPIAQITNATHAQAAALVSQAILDNPSSDAALRTELNKLRTGLPANTQITTYTYAPLIGITSQTDPNGRTTYYEYDAFNRLKRIKDHDGNTVKVMDYQYQKPITQ
ncbi:MAG: hypothetical protein EAY75_06235 [Bacteroidetes bacterium]|nr:MAG: hypothetical protein EAY75_06235 [Bacteroidota bacterium]